MEQHKGTDGFKYSPLPSQDSIRLLKLMPGVGDTPLAFTLSSTQLLSSAGQRRELYEALSYTWGDPTQQSEVLCGGARFLITASVFEALLHLRCGTSIRALWIDAICINQHDLEERASQVALMQFVYAQATRVIVWLGRDDDLTGTAINAIERLYNFIPQNGSLLERFNWATSEQKVPQGQRLTGLEGVALARFFQRAWFKRVWVIQEAVFADQAIVMCGDLSIKWDHLALVCHSGVLREAARVSAAMVRASPGILAIRRMEALRQTNNPVPFLNLLASARMLDATDPRDKLFAVKHLAQDDAYVSINYTIPVTAVYTQFAIACLANSLVDILAMVNPSGIKTPSKMRDLPSWVPDWSLKPNLNNYPGEFLPLVVAANHIRAAGDSTAVFSISPSSNVLTMRGNIVDVILTLGAPGAAGTSWDDSYARLEFEFNTFSHLESDTEPFETFLELLLCDTDINGDRISPRRLKPPHHFVKAMLSGPDQTPHLAGFIQQPLHPSAVLQSIRNTTFGRRFCTVNRGHMGWVPQTAQIGDVICCIWGARSLAVLRPKQSGVYSLVGECYLHGLMHGEALEIPLVEPQNFDII
jgi:hypothetical protein